MNGAVRGSGSGSTSSSANGGGGSGGGGSGGGGSGGGGSGGGEPASPPPDATLPMTATALAEVARQLVGAYTRLHGRSGGEPPALTTVVLGIGALAREAAERHAPPTTAPTVGAGAPAGATPRAAPPPPPPAAAPLSAAELRRLRHYLPLAAASYAPTAAAALAAAPTLDRSVGVLDGRWVASPYHPAYYVALDTATDAVVVAVRGTRTLGDVLTNLSASTDDDFLGHAAHRGVAAAAVALADRLGPRLADASRRHRPAGGVVLVGHSLGGAIASLLAAALRAADRGGDLAPLSCVAYAPPPCADAALAAAGAPAVTAVVLGDDAVPRLSAASVDRLVARAAAARWGGVVGAGVSRGLHGLLGGALGAPAVDALGGVVRSHGGGAAAAVCGALADWAAAQGGGRGGGGGGGSDGGGGGGGGGGSTPGGLWRAAMAVTSLTASLAGRQIAAGVAAAGRPDEPPAGAPAAGRATPRAGADGGRSYADIWASATVAGATARRPARGGGGGGGGRGGHGGRGAGRGGGGGGGDDADGRWAVARAYGVPAATVEAAVLGPIPPDLYLVGRVLLLARAAGPAGGGPAPAVAAAVVAATHPALHDVPVSEWMLADHATAAIGRALASLDAADGAGAGAG